MHAVGGLVGPRPHSTTQLDKHTACAHVRTTLKRHAHTPCTRHPPAPGPGRLSAAQSGGRPAPRCAGAPRRCTSPQAAPAAQHSKAQQAPHTRAVTQSDVKGHGRPGRGRGHQGSFGVRVERKTAATAGAASYPGPPAPPRPLCSTLHVPQHQHSKAQRSTSIPARPTCRCLSGRRSASCCARSSWWHATSADRTAPWSRPSVTPCGNTRQVMRVEVRSGVLWRVPPRHGHQQWDSTFACAQHNSSSRSMHL